MLQCSVCVLCRAAASEGGDDEDAGPDPATGTSAQQQVGEGEGDEAPFPDTCECCS